MEADFIAKNNVFRRILNGPYNVYADWILWAEKFQSNIYLYAEDVKSQDAPKGQLNQGHKFEQFFISSKSDF